MRLVTRGLMALGLRTGLANRRRFLRDGLAALETQAQRLGEPILAEELGRVGQRWEEAIRIAEALESRAKQRG